MIDAYLAGTLPTLTDIPLEEKKPGMIDKLRGVFTKNPFAKEEKKLNTALTYAGNQDLLDTLVGLLFRDRLASADPAHHADAALVEEPRHRRQADRRQHGALYARELCGARRRIARVSPQRAAEAAGRGQGAA